MIKHGYDNEGNYIHTLSGDADLVEMNMKEDLTYSDEFKETEHDEETK